MAWLRLWDDILDDPGLSDLPESTCWAWVLMLAVAKKFGRDGELPPLKKLAYMMHKPLSDVTRWTDELLTAGLLESNKLTIGNGVTGSPDDVTQASGEVENDATYYVHGWLRWQEPKDRTNAERQARFKAKKKSPSGLPNSERETERDRESDGDARAPARDVTHRYPPLSTSVTPLPDTHATDSPEAVQVRADAVRRWQSIDLEAEIQANELIRTWGAELAGYGLNMAFRKLGSKERPWAYANTICRGGIKAETNGSLPAEKPKSRSQDLREACAKKLEEKKAQGVLGPKGEILEGDE